MDYGKTERSLEAVKKYLYKNPEKTVSDICRAVDGIDNRMANQLLYNTEGIFIRGTAVGRSSQPTWYLSHKVQLQMEAADLDFELFKEYCGHLPRDLDERKRYQNAKCWINHLEQKHAFPRSELTETMNENNVWTVTLLVKKMKVFVLSGTNKNNVIMALYESLAQEVEKYRNSGPNFAAVSLLTSMQKYPWYVANGFKFYCCCECDGINPIEQIECVCNNKVDNHYAIYMRFVDGIGFIPQFGIEDSGEKWIPIYKSEAVYLNDSDFFCHDYYKRSRGGKKTKYEKKKLNLANRKAKLVKERLKAEEYMKRANTDEEYELQRKEAVEAISKLERVEKVESDRKLRKTKYLEAIRKKKVPFSNDVANVKAFNNIVGAEEIFTKNDRIDKGYPAFLGSNGKLFGSPTVAETDWNKHGHYKQICHESCVLDNAATKFSLNHRVDCENNFVAEIMLTCKCRNNINRVAIDSIDALGSAYTTPGKAKFHFNLVRDLDVAVAVLDLQFWVEFPKEWDGLWFCCVCNDLNDGTPKCNECHHGKSNRTFKLACFYDFKTGQKRGEWRPMFAPVGNPKIDSRALLEKAQEDMIAKTPKVNRKQEYERIHTQYGFLFIREADEMEFQTNVAAGKNWGCCQCGLVCTSVYKACACGHKPNESSNTMCSYNGEDWCYLFSGGVRSKKKIVNPKLPEKKEVKSFPPGYVAQAYDYLKDEEKKPKKVSSKKEKPKDNALAIAQETARNIKRDLRQPVVKEGSGKLRQAIEAIMLPEDCDPARYANGLSTVPTAVCKLKTIIPMSVGSGYYFQLNAAVMFSFYDPLRAMVYYESNTPGNAWSYTMYMTPGFVQAVGGMYQSNQVPVSSPIIIPNIGTSVWKLDFAYGVATSAFQPHGDTIFCGRSPEENRTYIPLSQADTIMINATGTPNSGNFTFRVWAYSGNGLSNFVGYGTCGTAYGFSALYPFAYYAFEIQANGVNTSTAYTFTATVYGSSATWAHRAVPEMSTKINQVKAFRVMAHSIRCNNIVAEQYKQGYAVAWMSVTGSDWTTFATPTGFDDITKMARSQSLGFKEGAYTQAKPDNVGIFEMKEDWSSFKGTTYATYYSLNDNVPYNVLAVKVTDPTGVGANWWVTHALEYTSTSQWVETATTNMRSDAWEEVFRAVAQTPQIYENEFHFSDITNWIKKAVPWVTKNVPAIIDKYGPIAEGLAALL